jgi:hypothetical protein
MSRAVFKVLVCGGRDFADQAKLERHLNALHHARPITHLIHGGARGADLLGAEWAFKRGIQPVTCQALWGFYEGAAGPVRNQAMLELGPDLVVAFPGGTGTQDMIDRARKAGVALTRVE